MSSLIKYYGGVRSLDQSSLPYSLLTTCSI